jgi:hypothetical protein
MFTQARRRLHQDLCADVHDRRAGKRLRAGQKLEQYDAQRPDVGAMIDVELANLFR